MPPITPPAQPGDPATLPPVSAPPAPVTGVPAQTAVAPAAAPAPATTLGGDAVVARARHLVEQYRGTPYQLSGALQELKSAYLAERFHINANNTQK